MLFNSFQGLKTVPDFIFGIFYFLHGRNFTIDTDLEEVDGPCKQLVNNNIFDEINCDEMCIIPFNIFVTINNLGTPNYTNNNLENVNIFSKFIKRFFTVD